jgi:hypothetical protein
VISGRAFLGTGVAALLVAGGLPALTSTASAVVPPDKMVLLGGTSNATVPNVYVANSDGSDAKIIHNGSKAQDPEFASLAPVNNLIVEVFADETNAASPRYGIALMNVDGSLFRVINTLPKSESVTGVDWDASANNILVSVETEKGGSYLGVADSHEAGPHLVELPGSTGLHSGSYSNHGDKTVVATTAGGAIVTLTGGKRTVVLRPPTDGALSSPVFSPDDHTIAFSSATYGSSSLDWRVQTIPSAGGVDPTTLASSGADLMPAWSSDGATVFFNRFSETSDTVHVYQVAASGSGSPTRVALPSSRLFELQGIAAPDKTPPVSAESLKVVINGGSPEITWGLHPISANPDSSHVVVRRLSGNVAPMSPTDGTLIYSGPKSRIGDRVTAGLTYTYALWVVDGAGHYSTPIKKSFVALAPPTLKAPALVSSVSHNTTFGVSWAPTSTNPVGTTYQVDWLNPNGAWVGWQNGVTATSATFGAAGSPVTPIAGKTYGLRVLVTDMYGNKSTLVQNVWVEPKDDSAAKSRGGWTKLRSSSDWLGTSRTTTQPGASLSVGLTGSTLWIIGDRQPTGSHALVYVDGKEVATINTTGHTLHRHILWTEKVKAGKHIVRIINVATKHHPRLSIDGFAAA